MSYQLALLQGAQIWMVAMDHGEFLLGAHFLSPSENIVLNGKPTEN